MQDWQNTQVWELHGPYPVSPNDVAASFSKALGRDVQAVALPESEWSSALAPMGFSSAAIHSYSEMIRAFNDGTLVIEKNGTNRIQGKTALDEVVNSWFGTTVYVEADDC
ncbi:MAG: hypothetical protein AAGA40_02185 [Cyanobacteria bacterium P01_E01_bin.45]